MRRLLLLVLLTWSAVAGSDEVRNDGLWWQSLSENAKSFYVSGFLDGISLGFNFSVWNNIKDETCLEKAQHSYSEHINKYLVGVRVGQLINGLDSFYTDYRNQRIKTLGAIWIVAQSIAGVPESEVSRLTESWRQNAK